MPHQNQSNQLWYFRSRLLVVIMMTLPVLPGCTSFWPGKTDDADGGAKLRELMTAPAPPELVREAAVAQGLHPVQVDGVGAIQGLPGTGGPADPSLFRDQLIEEMKRLDIDDPNHFLESNTTALVRVQTSIPPGARRGDPLDIKILAPNESRVKDLQGGWLLDTRLRQQMLLQKKLLQSSVRQSEVLAIAAGPILTRSAYTPGEDAALKIEGNLISGGRVQADRKLGLILRPSYQHVSISTALTAAINRRFFFFDGTTRRGIATAKEDDYIEIEMHPRYRDNVFRMMEVIRAVGVEPESSNTQKRLANLAERLKNPATAADAALQLEALGESAVPTLLDAVKSTNPELRFYAAETLSYLDREESVEPLEEAAREVAAFRAPALNALQGLKQQSAIAALKRLLNQPSLETRYGSFCGIRRRSDGRRELSGRALGNFWIYQVPSGAPPAVVASLRESPEIVLFGETGIITVPQFLRGPSGIMLKPEPDQSGRLRISRFEVGQDDKRVVVDSSIISVIAGLVSVGAGYGDVLMVLRTAKDEGYLTDQLAIDPLPQSMRTYYRDEDGDDEAGM